MNAVNAVSIGFVGFVGFVGFAALVAAGGCGPSVRRSVISTSAPSEYPGVLHDPRTLPHDFMVRQTLSIQAQKDGKPASAELDAVVQKQGDTLLIVGFGPMNVKAFTLTQRDGIIETVQFLGPPLPFSPRNVVVDVHRVYFKRLPAPAEAGYSGAIRGELDGETVEETWQDGQVRARVFTRPGGTLQGAVRIELGPGCDARHCEPESAKLSNEWFKYTLSIVNQSYERL